MIAPTRKGYAFEENLLVTVHLHVPKNLPSGVLPRERIIDIVTEKELIEEAVHPRPDFVERAELLSIHTEADPESDYTTVVAEFKVAVSYTVNTSESEIYLDKEDLFPEKQPVKIYEEAIIEVKR